MTDQLAATWSRVDFPASNINTPQFLDFLSSPSFPTSSTKTPGLKILRQLDVALWHGDFELLRSKKNGPSIHGALPASTVLKISASVPMSEPKCPVLWIQNSHARRLCPGTEFENTTTTAYILELDSIITVLPVMSQDCCLPQI